LLLDACSLLLVACSSGLALLTSAHGQDKSWPLVGPGAYSLFCSSMYFLDLSWSAFTIRRISSIASAILFNCSLSILYPFKIYPILSHTSCQALLAAWSLPLLSLAGPLKRSVGFPRSPRIVVQQIMVSTLHTSGSMDHSTNRLIPGPSLHAGAHQCNGPGISSKLSVYPC